MTENLHTVASPCVRNCCLDDDLTCLGCFRSIEEIKEWGIVDNSRREVILKNARERQQAHEKKYGRWP